MASDSPVIPPIPDGFRLVQGALPPIPDGFRLTGTRPPDALDTPPSGLDLGGIGLSIGDAFKNMGMGALKGASDIGTTIMRPVDAALNATGVTQTTNQDRKAALSDFFSKNADPKSLPFKTGELGADVAGTAGIGGALGQGVRAFPALANFLPKLAPALESGGFSIGEAAPTALGKVADMATRIGAGAAVGGASAGLINPKDAAAGAVAGGVLPPAAQAAGAVGRSLAAELTPEVFDLYKKAQALGIDIPADRIVNSRPLNALASSLNYVPFSGRAATEEKMAGQLNRALSRTFGQDSENVTMALRKASGDLGAKFDQVLSNNAVKVDEPFLTDLATKLDTAKKELGSDGARIISNQVEDILAKVGPSGEIDGQAAYNIKKALDRIGNRNAPEAYYARDLKKSLMGALDRSLGPEDAAAFKTVRQQYGNMLDLENLAQNGAEGGVSVARLANLKNINNPELQDIADIAAQFVKPREGAHGAAQRVMMGVGGAVGAATTPASWVPIASGVAAGRAANTALNSNAAKSLVLNQAAAAQRLSDLAGNPALRSLLYQKTNQANP